MQQIAVLTGLALPRRMFAVPGTHARFVATGRIRLWGWLEFVEHELLLFAAVCFVLGALEELASIRRGCD